MFQNQMIKFQFSRENFSRCVSFISENWNFSKFIFELGVFFEEILILDILLVAAKLNR